MRSIMQKTNEKEVNRVVELDVSQIVPNPNQPRTQFDREDLSRLAKSIMQDGILQPLTVRRLGGKYELVSGERRMRAAKMAGCRKVPCIVISVSEQASAFLALVENIQRQDLCFFDEAEAISKLITQYGLTQEKVALRLGMAQSTVANKLRLLKLSEAQRAEIMRLGLTERHARAVIRLETPQQRDFMIEKIAENNLNVERTETLIEKLLSQSKREDSIRRRAVVLRDVRLFMNTINKAVEVMKLAGVEADTRKIQSDSCIEYVITIPITQENKV